MTHDGPRLRGGASTRAGTGRGVRGSRASRRRSAPGRRARRRRRCAPRRGEIVAVVGPERLRQVDAARARLRAAGARRRARSTRAPGRADAPARPAAAVAERARQRGARAARRRARRARGARERARRAASRASASAGFERARPARALRRHAPARRLRAHAAGRASPCCASTSRSARSTRSRAREMQAWLADALAAEPRTVAAGHPRRRGGGRAGRPRRRALAAPGPRGRRRSRRAAAPARGDRPGASSRCASGRWTRCGRERVMLAAAARRRSRCSARWELLRAPSAASTAFSCPRPATSRTSLWDDRGLLWRNFTSTASEVLLGLRRGARRSASRCAVALHVSRPRCGAPSTRCSSPRRRSRSRSSRRCSSSGSASGIAPKLVIVALVCFFPIVVPTLDALGARRPRASASCMRTLGASRWQTLRHVEAPAALPAAVQRRQVAVAVAVIGAVFAE